MTEEERENIIGSSIIIFYFCAIPLSNLYILFFNPPYFFKVLYAVFFISLSLYISLVIFKNEAFLFIKLSFIHLAFVFFPFYALFPFLLQNLLYLIAYIAYLIFAGYLFFKNFPSEREEAEQKEKEKSERLTFSQYYRPKLGKLAETIAPIEATAAALPLRATLTNILAQFSALHLDPKDTTWYQNDNVFLFATENVPLETLKAVPQKVFTLPDGTTQNPEEVIRSLEKAIRNDRLTRAPSAGWHVYGLPHPNAEYLHESPHPEQYGVKPDDRFKHAYIIGKTGSGKTTLLRNLILQDGLERAVVSSAAT